MRIAKRELSLLAGKTRGIKFGPGKIPSQNSAGKIGESWPERANATDGAILMFSHGTRVHPLERGRLR